MKSLGGEPWWRVAAQYSADCAFELAWAWTCKRREESHACWKQALVRKKTCHGSLRSRGSGSLVLQRL
eukprot:1130654-Pelagomonas_calceolata.AAC.7